MLTEHRYTKCSLLRLRNSYHLSRAAPRRFFNFSNKNFNFQQSMSVAVSNQDLQKWPGISFLTREWRIDKKLKYLTPSWGSPSPFLQNTWYLGQLRTNLYTILSHRSPIYLICNDRLFLNILPHLGAALSPHIQNCPKSMISLAIDNGYLQHIQEVIY